MAEEFDVDAYIKEQLDNENYLDNSFRKIYIRPDYLCPNPDCTSAWHGLPKSMTSDEICPGSWTFDNSRWERK